MNKLYNKSELGFAIFWIIAYIVLVGIADGISAVIGIEKIITVIVLITMTVIVFCWIFRNKHMEKYGLCLPKHKARNYLYYLPLILMVSINLWLGVSLNFSILESVLYIISMLSVGFLEEIIFRGFLFKAMAKENLLSAIIVSSVTFGIGHLVNLFTGGGMGLLSNICQVFYAMSAGFLFVVIFYRGGSLIPCIIAHGLFNSLSCFMNYSALTATVDIIISLVIIVINVVYTLILLKLLPSDKNTQPVEDNNKN